MTIPTTAPPGYHPDPFGSGQLRWWDGNQWTEHLAQPAAAPAPNPWATPSGSYPSTYPTAMAPGSGSVLGTSPSRSFPVGPVVIVGLVVLSLIAAGLGWHARDARTPASTVTAPMTAPIAPGRVVITPAQAAKVLQTFWPIHQKALLRADVNGLRQLETGAAAAYEPGAIACGCLDVLRAAPLTSGQYFVPRQTSYPAYFVAEAKTVDYQQDWVEILVFTKAAASDPWLLEEDSGFAVLEADFFSLYGPSNTTSSGYVLPVTAAQQARATHLASDLAALWQTTKDSGQVPVSTEFQLDGQTGARLKTLASYRQDAVEPNGLNAHFHFYVDPADPLYVVPGKLGALACQAVRETVVYTPPAGAVIEQNSRQTQWGKLLAPGQYASETSHDAWQTCFLMDTGLDGPVRVTNQELGGSVPTGSR
jgi:hypothetical protein